MAVSIQKIPSPRIAFVQPTFTEAAYYKAFYLFYDKYNEIPAKVNVTTDVDLLTAHLNNSEVFCCKEKTAMNVLSEQIKYALPNATITYLIDEDIHEGRIFSNNHANTFDILIVFKDEYLTQQMYDNYKQFVSQGGTIIFLNGNFFYAEVNYDKNARTITLVKGHSWEFDGTTAKRSAIERWFNTTKEWVGSNFATLPSNTTLNFANNIFNYTHNEENYVNNNNDIIILDYGAYTNPLDRIKGKIATYELNYEHGKVIVVGLFGEDLLNNENFLDFFKNTIIQYAVLEPAKVQQSIMYDSNGIPIVYYGTIIGYQRNPVTTSFTLIKYCNDYAKTKNSTDLKYLENNANWLVTNARSYGNYSLFEYQFPYVYNLIPPWHSALAQGLAIQALTRAFQITENATYLHATVPLLNSFYVDVKDGGITEKTENLGWWYEEYAEKNGKNPRVLNGMMYTLLSLSDYYNYTNSTKAKFLFDQGIEALKNNISNYDVNGTSYYDAQKTYLASPFYQGVHVTLLNDLYKITGDPVFKKYRDEWESYIKLHG